MSGLGTPLLIAIFAAGALATWLAGMALSKGTDALDARLGLGEEFGGLVLLAIAGSLPELAITVSAAAGGHLSLAAGNLIGGIAVQTMVLLICDAFAGDKPLSFLVGVLTPVLEGLLVVIVVCGVMMGSLLKESTAIGGVVSPASVAICAVWAVGLYVINRARKDPRWNVTSVGSRPGRAHRREPLKGKPHPYAAFSTGRVALIFGAACIVTLVAGVALEESGDALANHYGVGGVVFGATILATASALPEISSGIAAVRLGDNALAMGDIFGGNAFQVCLFLLADLIAGTPVLPSAGSLNAWLAALGVALTGVYGFGVISRPNRCHARLGPDSLLALLVFGLGIAGLFVVPH
jgi:cation:H+ antiporter